MNLPEHVTATVETTTKYRCTVCGSRLIPGVYENSGYVQQVVNAWLNRHTHDQPAPTTEREP